MSKKTAQFNYLGNLRTQVVHLKSGNELVTDAPLDNNGKGEAFSPTDLLAVSLVTCMVTVMGIRAEKKGWQMGEVKGWVEKTMASNPRRIHALKCEIEFSRHSLSKMEKRQLEDVAMNCPVAKSIHPDILTQIEFKFD